jgi:hypothetical protein
LEREPIKASKWLSHIPGNSVAHMQICLDIRNVRDNMRVLWWKNMKSMRRLGRKGDEPEMQRSKRKRPNVPQVAKDYGA